MLNKKFCECGCGKEVNNRFVRGHSNYVLRKGKKLNEIYDSDKAKKILNNLKKSYVEKHGTEKAKIIKEKISEQKKGISYEQRFGIEKANKIKEKIILKRQIDKKIIINKAKKYYNEIGPYTKTEFIKFIWNHETIRQKFGSLDNFAKEANIRFKKTLHYGRLGLNEKEILDKIEKLENIKLERQTFINGVFIDGYDIKNNTVYEVDEKYHKYTKVQDKIKENKVKNVLNCKFIRIKESDFLLNFSS